MLFEHVSAYQAATSKLCIMRWPTDTDQGVARPDAKWSEPFFVDKKLL